MGRSLISSNVDRPEIEAIPEPYRLAGYDYPLDPLRVAQRPAAERDGARLLVVERDGALRHRSFCDIGAELRAGDLLVLNDSRVVPARILAVKSGSGGKVEILLLQRRGPDWEALVRGSVRVGQRLALMAPDSPMAEIREALGSGRWRLRFVTPAGAAADPDLERIGRPPLPPYIRRPADPDDRERYQTVYARVSGSVAAPTAGLHFAPRTLVDLQLRGIGVAFVTLHIGLGTFRPVEDTDIRRHRMHAERFDVPNATAIAVKAARAAGGRVVAVGTSALRVLETAAGAGGTLRAGSGETDLFIYPGFKFGAVDALLTNFHMPRSTLLMLVAAFAGQDVIRAAYATATDHDYRFLSYGDAMLIL